MADLDLYNQVAQNGKDPILAYVGLVKNSPPSESTYPASDGCRRVNSSRYDWPD